MQDKTIDNALLALRKRAIRGDRCGLTQVEALLTMRDVTMSRVLPAKRPDAARRGHMRLLVLASIKAGDNTHRAIAGYVAARRPEISPEAAFKRVGQCLARLQRGGVVRREGRVWLAR